LISGNQTGISIVVNQADGSFPYVQGNFIGTNVSGTSAIPNVFGINDQAIPS